MIHYFLALISGSLSLPDKIFAGEITYARIPAQYWEHRIIIAKAMGLNALTVNCMWNYHESKSGVFDFATENRNLSLFLELVKKHDMHVLLSPGPYVGAEWDFGGLPYFILKSVDQPMRALNPSLLNRTAPYFAEIAKIVRPFLAPSGPIIMIQIDYNQGAQPIADPNYTEHLLEIWQGLLGNFQFYHADQFNDISLTHVQGLSIGLIGETSPAKYQEIREKYPDAKIVFGYNVQSGLATPWGLRHMSKQDKNKALALFKSFVHNNLSFSMSVVHGGTNFGFTNGYYQTVDVFFPYVTSYDYDAPINEHGLNTPKYDDLRKMFKESVPWDVPNVPLPILIKAIPKIKPKRFSTFNALGSYFPLKFQRDDNRTFGNWTFQQNDVPHGMMSYRLTAPSGINIIQLEYYGYAYIVINEERIAFPDPFKAQHHFLCRDDCTVEITIESQSHASGNAIYHQRKGLKNITSDFQITAMACKITPFFPEDVFSVGMDPTNVSVGYFYQADFTLQQITDTYLDMSQFTKGYLFVNGRNLGRYWKIGPQFKLFCPGAWLKSVNKMIIFDENIRDASYVTSDQRLQSVSAIATLS